MNFEKVNDKYVEDMITLARQEYEAERELVPALMEFSFEEKIKEILSWIQTQPYGKVALEDGKVVGYLLFGGPWDGFFGNAKGLYSPLGANAFGGSRPDQTFTRLFQNVSSDFIKGGVSSVALTRFAHAKDAESIVRNGFGVRCSDAVMSLQNRKNVCKLSNEFIFEELHGEDRKHVNELRTGLIQHLSQAPIFFPTPLEDLDKWFEDPDRRVFVVRSGEEYIGFMGVTDDAETYITGDEKILNICGAFVKKEFRGKGAAAQLLEFVCQTLSEEGMTYLGVDCETLNPNAFYFWGKYFSKYTYSYARRIDERAIGYEDYFNSKMR